MATDNNRWWERYLTRYLIGTIVGSICILYLIEEGGCNNPLVNILRKSLVVREATPLLEMERFLAFLMTGGSLQQAQCGSNLANINIWKLGAIGFAHCYLISAPFTLLHYLRNFFWRKHEKPLSAPVKNWIFFQTNVGFWILFLLVSYLGSFNPQYAAIFMIIVFLFAVIILRWAVFSCTSLGSYKNAKALSVYKLSGCCPRVADVNTYKDLSEHGNAYSIVILQVASTVFLSSHEINGWFHVLGYLVPWVGMGAICWYAARTIENFFIQEENK